MRAVAIADTDARPTVAPILAQKELRERSCWLQGLPAASALAPGLGESAQELERFIPVQGRRAGGSMATERRRFSMSSGMAVRPQTDHSRTRVRMRGSAQPSRSAYE
jgi:hypothetical protein